MVGVKLIRNLIGCCKDKKSYDLSEESHDAVYHSVVARSKKDPQQDVMTNIDIAMSGHASDKMIEYIREKELLVAELA